MKIKNRVFILSFWFLTIALTASCSIIHDDPGFGVDSDRLITQKVKIMFTDPGKNRGDESNTQIEEFIVSLILSAEDRIDIALYQISLDSVVNALEVAASRGVRVRIVGDEGEAFSYGYYKLRSKGLEIRSGNKAGLQHNKFIIVDKKKLFTGTGNFTETGIYHNNNTFLYIEDELLSRYYHKEFDKMFAGFFGRDKIPFYTEESRIFSINGARYEVYFSPAEGDRAVSALADLIFSARKSIHYMIFAFTHDELASSLLYASSKNNIPVYGIHDAGFLYSTGSEASRIFSAGFRDKTQAYPNGPFIRVDGNENYLDPSSDSHGGKMHAKVLLIDAGTEHAALAIGSFNWSDNAVYKNDENLMIIRDPRLVDMVLKQFERAWQISESFTSRGVQAEGSLLSNSSRAGEIIISEVGISGIIRDALTGEEALHKKNDLYVEIYNRSDTSIDLTHWSLAWGRDNFSFFPFEKSYPIPGKTNAYTKSKRSCNGEEAQWNIICAGEYKLIYTQTDPSFMGFTENNEARDTSPHIKISSSKKFESSVFIDADKSQVKLILYDKRMNVSDRISIDLGNYPEPDQGTVYSLYRRAYRESEPSSGMDGVSWIFPSDQQSILYYLYDAFGKRAASPPGFDWNENGRLDFSYGSPGYANGIINQGE